ncbi:MAG: signal recognition particle protein [Methanomicrobia archaeon]|nr:signal recognition particle protein [Methanomicrobia archaeon]RLF94832.1 MAG: signal recognition particle protein [Thermococci archaeon]
MVLEVLGEALNKALKKLTKGVVDEKLIKEIVRDIQRALIAADVNIELVFQLSKNIEKRALEEKLPKGVSRKEHIIRIVYDELTKILGEEPEKIHLKPSESTIFLMIGIQGSGKTTTTGKLARFFQKRGFKVGVVCSDTWRPGAYQQLQQYCSPYNIEVFGDPEEKDAIKLAKNGVKHFRKKKNDIIIVDTAGRHKEEKGLIEEMKKISKAVNPDEIILVIDGTIGQQAMAQAKAFSKAAPVGSIIVTKLDGSAKGGGALSSAATTKAKIKFIGEGEKIDDIEEFDPKKFVSRLLGLGDLETLLKKVKEAATEEIDEKYAEKFMTGKFNLRDMYKQLEMVSNMGSLQKIMQMIPGMGFNLPKDVLETSEEKLKIYKIIMDSMTEKELEKPKIINYSRIKRISKGSGRNEKDVRELLNQYNMMKKMFKQFGKKRLPKMGMFKGMKM